MKRMLIALVALMSINVMAGEHGKAHDHEAAGLVMSKDAFVRGLPPGQANTAAFGTFHNTMDKALTLAKLKSPVAETVELHSHAMVDGTMQMRKIENFTIAAGEKAVFAPGSNHIMLMGLKQPLKEGETILLEMCFDNLCAHFQVPVISVLNEHKQGGDKHHHHHH